MNYEETLILAIQSQQQVVVKFTKETTKEVVVREVAPYDVYNKRDKNDFSRRILQGYCWEHKNYKANPIYIYLDTISDVRPLGRVFDGPEVRRLINPKGMIQIPRPW